MIPRNEDNSLDVGGVLFIVGGLLFLLSFIALSADRGFGFIMMGTGIVLALIPVFTLWLEKEDKLYKKKMMEGLRKSPEPQVLALKEEKDG